MSEETEWKSLRRLLIETMDVKKAVSYVKNIIFETRSGKIEMEKLIVWKRMTRPQRPMKLGLLAF